MNCHDGSPRRGGHCFVLSTVGITEIVQVRYLPLTCKNASRTNLPVIVAVSEVKVEVPNTTVTILVPPGNVSI